MNVTPEDSVELCLIARSHCEAFIQMPAVGQGLGEEQTRLPAPGCFLGDSEFGARESLSRTH